ncbi:MAG: ABC transporter substrate-binding protein [Thermodesulfobacteriota bacterium]
MKRCIIIILILFIFYPLSLFAQKNDILVIESYHSEFPWDASYKKGISEVLGNKYNLVYFEMDTKRLPKSEFEKRAQMAWDEYKKVDPVLVILGDDNALKYLGPKFIKTDTPVVYLGINNNPRVYNIFGHDNFTGTLERPLLKRSILFINKIKKIKKALLLFDASPTSEVLNSEIFYGKKSMEFGGVKSEIKLITKYSDWKKNVLNAEEKGYDVIFVGLYQSIIDDNGMHVNDETIVKWTSEHTTVPVFGFWDFAVGPDKTIGGYVLSGEEQGKTAGKIALNILSGKKAGNIFPEIAPRGKYLFSKFQLKKWCITIPDHIDSKAEYTK